MKIRVTLDEQPKVFLGALPPSTKRLVRERLHDIERGEASPVALDDELDGFYKIKVEQLRLIAEQLPSETGPHYHVVFAERRPLVYVLFKQLLGLE